MPTPAPHSAARCVASYALTQSFVAVMDVMTFTSRLREISNADRRDRIAATISYPPRGYRCGSPRRDRPDGWTRALEGVRDDQAFIDGALPGLGAALVLGAGRPADARDTRVEITRGGAPEVGGGAFWGGRALRKLGG